MKKKTTRKKKKTLPHEEAGPQTLAAWYHIGFAALYFVAIVWHLKGAREHFNEVK